MSDLASESEGDDDDDHDDDHEGGDDDGESALGDTGDGVGGGSDDLNASDAEIGTGDEENGHDSGEEDEPKRHSMPLVEGGREQEEGVTEGGGAVGSMLSLKSANEDVEKGRAARQQICMLRLSGL